MSNANTPAASAPAAMPEHRDLKAEDTSGRRYYHARETKCEYVSRREYYFENGVAVCRRVDRSPVGTCTAPGETTDR